MKITWFEWSTQLALIVGALLLVGCGFLGSPPVRSALEAVAPQAVDALAKAVTGRWGEDAQVDEDSAGCFPAPANTADAFGDDDREYEYVTCRVKAR